LTTPLLAALREVLGPPDPVHPLHVPRFGGNESRYTQECIDSTFVSSVGPFVDRFEEELAAVTGAGKVVAVVNGTAALHMALLLSGVEPGDEVLVPALTFVATAAAVRYCGAVPHFVEVEETTLGMDPEALRSYLGTIATRADGTCRNRETGRRLRAMVPVHVYGQLCRIEELVELAAEYGIALVEDAAEALGSRLHGRHAGTFAPIGTLSFNGNKTLTTGGGGALLLADEATAHRARHLTTTAKVPHRWEYDHDELGYNYRLPNLNAALGCAQLEQLPEFLRSKRALFQRYREALAGVDGVRLLEERPGTESNYWLQTLLLDEDRADERDALLAATNEAGYLTRPAWKLMNHLRPYADCPTAPLPVAESLERRVINLPSSAGLA
jgi:perosamine synthetase